jgi:hypothetical protein
LNRSFPWGALASVPPVRPQHHLHFTHLVGMEMWQIRQDARVVLEGQVGAPVGWLGRWVNRCVQRHIPRTLPLAVRGPLRAVVQA